MGADAAFYRYFHNSGDGIAGDGDGTIDGASIVGWGADDEFAVFVFSIDVGSGFYANC